MYSAVPQYLLSLNPAVVGVPGCNLTNSWMVSREVDESLETSGLLRCTLAPQAIATFSISVWSVETHMLEKQNCTVVIVVCSSVLLVTWLFLLHRCRYYTWVCQWQNEALVKRGKKHPVCADLAVSSTHLTVDCVIIKAPWLWKIKVPLESGTSPTFNELFCGQLSTFPFHLLELPFKPCPTTSLAEAINAFKRAPTDSLCASIALLFFHVSRFLMFERSVLVVAYLHVDRRVSVDLTVPVKPSRVHRGPQHPSDERNSGQHFNVFQRDPFTSSSRQNQGGYVSTDIRPDQLAGVTVITQQASFSGSHGRACKSAAKGDNEPNRAKGLSECDWKWAARRPKFDDSRSTTST